jgi:ATP-dependent DNA ligase
LNCQWKPSLQDKPDCWISRLNDSIVLEVKAAEMINSDSYPTGYTLRFPRVVKIRFDKDWNESLKLTEMEELLNQNKYSKNLKRKLD